MSAPARVIRAYVQKVARRLRDDPAFPWRACCRGITNEAIGVPTITPNVATALCYGRNAPFTTIGEVPAHILAEAEAGVAEALAIGKRIPADGAALGRALGMTQELREELKVWAIWPMGSTYDDLAARRSARAAERRAKDRVRKEQQRREQGMAEREKYEANSVTKLAPWEAIGMSRASFYRLPAKERSEVIGNLRKSGCHGETSLSTVHNNSAADRPVSNVTANGGDGGRPSGAPTSHVTPDVASVSGVDSNCSADRPATKRDTLAEQARAMGISPATLRKRLQRERQRQQQAEPVTLSRAEPQRAEPVTLETSETPAPLFLTDPDVAKSAVAGAPAGARPAPAASSSEKGRGSRYIIGPAGQRPPLPPQPHMPASIPGRNILQAIGVENGALVIRLAHEAALIMLRARDLDGDPADNALRMIAVWEEQRRAMRRELVSRGASFVDCLHATAAFAAITERETAEASRYSAPAPVAFKGHAAAQPMATL
ncbi:MAG: hypothetical protein ACR652_03330 [Methylocystis sp.]|uniref:hypothetical protein n=1 Tax=Methylocystis sp. TaxID=1911079 RepID=UPI003DA6BF2C